MLPKFYPMLAKAGKEDILGSTRYQYEPKLDGQRCLLYVQDGKVKLQSRSGRDMTTNFPEVVSHIESRVWNHSHVFDGEIVVFKDGKVDFQALSTRMQRQHSVDDFSRTHRAEFIAFDVLVSYGNDITSWSLEKRRARLEHYESSGSPFDISCVIPPAQVLDAYAGVKARGDEGLMAKLLTSPYRWGERSDEWLKIKPTRTMEVYIGGCTWGIGKRTNDFGALLVGRKDPPYLNDGALHYLGSVGTGFTDVLLRDLRILIDDNECEDSPFCDFPIKEAQGNNVRAYCTPKLRALVEFQEQTRDGKLRFPAFRELLV